MTVMASRPCGSAREHADMGEEKPGGCGGDGGFEVLGEASASAEPGLMSIRPRSLSSRGVAGYAGTGISGSKFTLVTM
jgi:hypothetical protein